MRLTLENFFTHLIFCPCKADSVKDGMTALVASIACGVFSLGMCHVVCLIRNCCKHRPPREATDQDRRVSSAKNTALGPKNSSSMTPLELHSPDAQSNLPVKDEVRINPNVKKTLDKLFEGSRFSVDTLPVYSIIIDRSNPTPKRESMTAPIMKGKTNEGQVFIIIKVDSKDDDPEDQLKDIIILTQDNTYGLVEKDGKREHVWIQLNAHERHAPSFFTGPFTFALDGSGPTEREKQQFPLVQALLKGQSAVDLRRQEWHMPKYTQTNS